MTTQVLPLRSKLDRAIIASLLAVVAMNVVVLSSQLEPASHIASAALTLVGKA
ncbi:MAG: hypothetical protein KGL44_01715 [Sphingomonadales bacterium]|nr:hypothetical protein [Sphingomonadales bacterium]